MTSTPRIALFPASFDPVTNGHLDIARRARRLFDEVVLAVAVNLDKTGCFPIDERIRTLQAVIESEPGLRATPRLPLAHPGGTQLVRALRDVEGDLALDLPIHPAGAHRVPQTPQPRHHQVQHPSTSSITGAMLRFTRNAAPGSRPPSAAPSSPAPRPIACGRAP